MKDFLQQFKQDEEKEEISDKKTKKFKSNVLFRNKKKNDKIKHP